MTAKRVIDKHGVDDVVLLFADVAGDRDRCDCGHLNTQHDGVCANCECQGWVPTTHAGEDQDTYRFIEDAVAQLGARFVTVTDHKGRDIWEVYRTRRFLGNSRQANCSIELKQKPCAAWLKENCDPGDTTVYVGIDWTEEHRLPAIKKAYAQYGFNAEAPLCEPPLLDKPQMIEAAVEAGIKPPRAYEQGFPHNNCGGFCVRAGKAQFKKLLELDRDRYMFHEQREQELREYLDKDVTVLTERVKGEKVRLTLRGYRERLEEQPDLFTDEDSEWGGCGCFSQFETPAP